MTCNESPPVSRVDFSGLKRITDRATLLSNSNLMMPCDHSIASKSEGGYFSNESSLSFRETIKQPSEEYEPSVTSDRNSPSPIPMEVEESTCNVQVIDKFNAREPNGELDPVEDFVSIAMDVEGEGVDESGLNQNLLREPPEDRVSQEKKINRTSRQSVTELRSIPLWGFTSIRGGRPEMEDAVATVPRFMQIPTQFLIDDSVSQGKNQSLGHFTAHFFGVYDGHGGSQVADYCSKRLHLALAEEIELAKSSFCDDSTWNSWQDHWKKLFANCFLKVDAETGESSRGATGSNGGSKPIATETVGSTAVVAIVCPTHIIVANCGDSRAVLHRGKVAMPLSADHKPDREDERARIEGAGGKVIQWNGSRVFGVLAMSRSIGDRYLKPWIIPDPEVTFIPRTKEDECLILASDGLWDVMTNEEACDIARKRILLCHKRNGDTLPAQRGGGVNPAAREAAERLSKLALQKGSKDNIAIIETTFLDVSYKPKASLKVQTASYLFHGMACTKYSDTGMFCE
ncbi:unnamed protein product [Dovyalis caffra]|uniref:protein-serine/threonine phosphatase n=1 Tax=Dovyalis caffra TaxID=77055 RepID=A0AAV1SNH9_9ROSI|nr:unnamed protein product [Dovyalis caffra]